LSEETILLTNIIERPEFQPRLKIRWDVIEEYAQLMEDGVIFPPIDVFLIDEKYFLVDGYHRKYAAERTNKREINCVVHLGGLRDAHLFSCQVNSVHGMPRTREEKRRAVERVINDPEWEKFSSREIARVCGVSNHFVDGMRGGNIPTPTAPTSEEGQSEPENRPDQSSEPPKGFFWSESRKGTKYLRKYPEKNPQLPEGPTDPKRISSTESVECPFCGRIIKEDIIKTKGNKIKISIDHTKQKRESYK